MIYSKYFYQDAITEFVQTHMLSRKGTIFLFNHIVHIIIVRQKI